jgi:hypothetical protein
MTNIGETLFPKVIAMNHSKLILRLFLGSALLSMSLVLSSTISNAEARHNHHLKESDNRGPMQTNICNNILSCTESDNRGPMQTNICNNTTTCTNTNMATTILCQHATCIIGDITPFLVPKVH